MDAIDTNVMIVEFLLVSTFIVGWGLGTYLCFRIHWKMGVLVLLSYPLSYPIVSFMKKGPSVLPWLLSTAGVLVLVISMFYSISVTDQTRHLDEFGEEVRHDGYYVWHTFESDGPYETESHFILQKRGFFFLVFLAIFYPGTASLLVLRRLFKRRSGRGDASMLQ